MFCFVRHGSSSGAAKCLGSVERQVSTWPGLGPGETRLPNDDPVHRRRHGLHLFVLGVALRVAPGRTVGLER